jgi:hypothetical protein
MKNEHPQYKLVISTLKIGIKKEMLKARASQYFIVEYLKKEIKGAEPKKNSIPKLKSLKL